MADGRCGRPTKTGAPCKSLLLAFPEGGVFKVACGKHATDADRDLERALHEAYKLGEARGRLYAQSAVERVFTPKGRTHDSQGRQLVMVGAYTYHWGGAEVSVGDEVIIPASEWYGPTKKTVTAVSSEYPGATRSLVGLAAN